MATKVPTNPSFSPRMASNVKRGSKYSTVQATFTQQGAAVERRRKLAGALVSSFAGIVVQLKGSVHPFLRPILLTKRHLDKHFHLVQRIPHLPALSDTANPRIQFC